MNKLYATHHAQNPASGRVILKNGMQKEGELVQHIKCNGRYHDLWPYCLASQEHARCQAPSDSHTAQ